MEQVWGAIGAVFGSWMNDRAVVYRRTYGIPHDWGTAVNVQAMVFGNLGDDCATGVAMTRDVALGEPGLNGDYLSMRKARTLWPASAIRSDRGNTGQVMPGHAELVELGKKLEAIIIRAGCGFTIQRGKVWMLQTRNAKRTGFAAVRIAVDMVNEGLISKEEALRAKRIPADDLNQLLQPIYDPNRKRPSPRTLLAKGINADLPPPQDLFHA
jgi:pyruvate,orthophosphate dikinase